MKDLKISKELLSEVLNLNITYIECCNNSIVYKISVYDREEEINIYEFVFKCKEWAFSKGYIISSGLTPVLGVNKDGWAEVFSSSTPLDGKLHTFKQLSEPEAVFKACEWILKHKENQCTK